MRIVYSITLIYYMKNHIILLLLVVAALANVHPHPDPIITHIPKVYKVNI